MAPTERFFSRYFTVKEERGNGKTKRKTPLKAGATKTAHNVTKRAARLKVASSRKNNQK